MENIERQMPKPFEIYRHFKGNLYQVLNVATHSETGELLVIYQALYGEFGIYARPLDMFLSETDKEKYPESKEKYRFTKVKSDSKQAVPVSLNPAQVLADSENTPAGDSLINSSQASDAIYDKEAELKKAQELFMEFLDEDDFNKKRNILKAISGIATESMINNMAASLDLVTAGVSRDSDIKMIDDYIRARIHFDGNRLRD